MDPVNDSPALRQTVGARVMALLVAVRRGEAGAVDELFGVLYSDLRQLAHSRLRRSGQLTLLDTTGLVHEAYVRLFQSESLEAVDRSQFMAYAARVMRGLIVDDVRRRRSEKRGGLFQITHLHTEFGDSVSGPQALIGISEALDELADVEPELAEIIELKFFCGFSFAEIAAMRGVSERTVQRGWEKGRLYLHHAIAGKRLQ